MLLDDNYFRSLNTRDSSPLLQANRPVEVAQQYDLLRLQTQAFEAINEMVRSASTDTLPLVGHLIPVVLERIAATMDPAAAGGKDKPGDLQVRSLDSL